MHCKSVEVLFKVDGIKRRISSTIGVKQGDLWGPELFTFFMAGVMETWRSRHDYEYAVRWEQGKTSCSLPLAGNRTTNTVTGGKNVPMGSNTPNLPSPTPNMPMLYSYTFLRSSRCWKEHAVIGDGDIHGAFSTLGSGLWRFTQDPTTFSRAPRLNYFAVLGLYRRTQIQARMTTRIWVIWFYQ